MQSKHAVAPLLFWKVPAAHGTGSGAPAGQWLPLRQSLHASLLFARVTGWYVPALQLVQVALLLAPSWSLHVPGGQACMTIDESAPTSSQKVPARHSWQTVCPQELAEDLSQMSSGAPARRAKS